LKWLKDNEVFRVACIYSGIMCLLALLPLHMDSFYSVVRFSVTVVSLWALLGSLYNRQYLLLLVFGGLAIIFNAFHYIQSDIVVRRIVYVAAFLSFATGSSTVKVDNIFERKADTEETLEQPTSEYLNKSAERRTGILVVSLLIASCFFAGLQIWGAAKFRGGVSEIDKHVQQIRERLDLLQNTAGEQNVFVFLDNVQSLDKQCRQEEQAMDRLKRECWFVLPFLTKEGVSEDITNLCKRTSKLVAVRLTVETFARRLKEADSNLVGILEAIGDEDPDSMVIELAAFEEDSESLRRDIERMTWPAEMEPFKTGFIKAIDERSAALVALLHALRSAAEASSLADQAVSTYVTAWSIWDYQQVLDYLEASKEYSEQAEGYLAEFEYHSAKYLKIRDRLIEDSTEKGENWERNRPIDASF